MSLPRSLQTFFFSNTQQEIFIPGAAAVQQLYSNNKHAAYWAQVWPASIGLCNFLYTHPHYIARKSVLELAAGLGLPGLYAATMAKQVTITDREERAVACITQSIAHLQLKNADATILDWKDAAETVLPGVVLLSDVNYEPEVFGELMNVLEYFLHNKVIIIISTPQRLVAKPFINKLLPYCTRQWNGQVVLNEKETGVSVFVLEG
ncbi:MAG: methyltransferase [Agriterribacter sp.]